MLATLNYNTHHAVEKKQPRRAERQVDKTVMKARLTAGALRRSIGPNEAKRYLERNGYSNEVICDILQNSTERRIARRRSAPRPARFQSARHSASVPDASDVFDPLTKKEIQLLFGLRLATDSSASEIRVTDYPAHFAHFGLMELNIHGTRITERGRTVLLHWTRVKALLAISIGHGMQVHDVRVQIWLENNRFIVLTSDGLVATPRGLRWIATHTETLGDL